MYYKGTNLKPIRKYESYFFNKRKDAADLERMGYRDYRSISSTDDHVYAYVFPVYRYHASINLEARFLVHLESGEIKVDVFDTNTKGVYAPWYCDESGAYNYFIETIDKNISKEMKRQDIRIV